MVIRDQSIINTYSTVTDYFGNNKSSSITYPLRDWKKFKNLTFHFCRFCKIPTIYKSLLNLIINTPKN